MTAAQPSATTASATVDTPTGPVVITARDDAIVGATWAPPGTDTTPANEIDHPLLARAAAQLGEYFAGDRRDFDLPLDPPGSDLQRAVCRAMLAIPFGETRTYGDLARALGVAAQPVGQACGGNPIPILIPCHRVVAAGGKLGGFSGGRGTETKLALLRHEGALLL